MAMPNFPSSDKLPMTVASTTLYLTAGKAYRKKPVAGEFPLFFLWAICPSDIIGPSKQDALPGNLRPLSQHETYFLPAVSSKFAPDHGGVQVHA